MALPVFSSCSCILHMRKDGNGERGSEEGRIPNRKSLVTQNSSSCSSTLPHDLGQIVSSLSPVFSSHKIMDLDNKT